LKPEGLVIENYTKHDEKIDGCIKSIVNPRTVIKENIHHANYFFEKLAVNENGISIKGIRNQFVTNNDIKKIRINHYYTKSYEEYTARLKKNLSGDPDCQYYQTIPEYNPDYLSTKEDRIMDAFIPVLKARLAHD
jgi:hypothetical protein